MTLHHGVTLIQLCDHCADVVVWCSDSQFEDEHHICAVLVHVVQRDDVGVRDLLQDVHLPLDLLSPHATPAGPTLPLLDELGCIFDACTLVYTAFDDRKLPTAETKEGKTTC